MLKSHLKLMKPVTQQKNSERIYTPSKIAIPQNKIGNEYRNDDQLIDKQENVN